MPLYYLLRWSILILIGLLLYAQTFQFGFVFDDHIFIVANPYIKNFNNIHLMWHAFPMTRLVGMYSFAVNYYFNQLHPSGYHVFNFLVHLTATGLVWALAGLLFRMTKSFPSRDRLTQELPLIIAILFLVHPCQTQAVTYITQRFESMATVFYLATIYFYLRARLSTQGIQKIILFTLAGLSTGLGILTKEVVITTVGMIIVLELIFFPGEGKKKVYVVLATAAVLLGILFSQIVHAGLNVFVQSVKSESHDGDVLTPVYYFLTQMRVFLTFLRLLLLPVHQNLDYDYPASMDLFHPPLTIIGLGVIIGFILLVIKLRRKFPLIAFGLAWMLITFSINLAPRSNVIFEHKLYLISFGFLLASVAALMAIIPNRWTLVRVLLCVVVALSLATFNRNKVWANELVLWKDCVRSSPHKARVNANLGRIYGSLGQYDQAINYFSRAIAISPDNITYENRGIIYSQLGQSTQALEDLNRSIAMDPHYFSTYVKRSWVYQTQHRYQEALNDLAYAISLEPGFEDAYIERGMLWMQVGHLPEALEDFQQVLRIDPFNFQVLVKEGSVFAALKNYDLALKDFKKAKLLEPTFNIPAMTKGNE